MNFRMGIPRGYRLAILGLCGVLGAVIIAIGFVHNASAKKLKAACTARAEGVVTAVGTSRGKNGSAYALTIVFAAGSGQRYEFTTGHTGNKREKGDAVEVFYDPADPDKLYAETDPPETGGGDFVMGGVLFAFGILFYAGLIPQRNSGRSR